MDQSLLSTVLYAAVIFLLTVAAGYATEAAQNKLSGVFPYVNAFSCGVVLGAAFTHLLPEAAQDIAHLDLEYPVASACALLGFTFLCGLETLLHGHPKNENLIKTDRGDTLQQTVLLRATSSDDHGATGRVGGSKGSAAELELPMNTAPNERTRLFFPSDDGDDPRSHSLHADGLHRAGKQCVTPSKMRQLEFHKHRDHFHTHISSGSYSSASATIFWAALFAHSIMEGIGLGVTSSMQQFAIFAAVILHKGFAAMALSIALLESGISKSSYHTLYGAFALAAPCGAILGYLVHADARGVGPGIVTALAAGSFVYIGTVEMLPIMLRQCENQLLALLCFVTGASLFAGLAAVV